MADRKALQTRSTNPFHRLRDAVRGADEWPLAGNAVRRFLDAESWALAELKQRLDAMESEPKSVQPSRGGQSSPRDLMADLVRRSHRIDPDAARDALYCQTLNVLVPDQIAMISLLSDRGAAPLVHVAASRLPAGPTQLAVLTNHSSLGRDAGVLLREQVPLYMTRLIDLGLLQVHAESAELEQEYELLMADTLLRARVSHVRTELRMYPRIQRFSVALSEFGASLWHDCRPAGRAGSREGDRA